MGIQVTNDRTAPAEGDERWPRWRVWAIRIWYGLLSLWALAMSLGVVNLVLGKAGPGDHFISGMVTALKLLAVGGVLGICWTGGRSVVAFQAVVVGLIGWSGSDLLDGVHPDDTPVASTIATLALWILPLVLLRPHRGELLRLHAQPSAILLSLALTAAVPMVIYAVRQDNLSLNGYEDAISIGLVLAAQTLFAALRPRGSRWLPRLVALAAAWIGVLAVTWPHDVTSPGRAWGAVLICWAILFVGANELQASRDPAPGAPSAPGGRR
jgi:hypothetical protein